ncbi:hypothetical protein [Breoghania sp.]|uniref:hypothetical protein n=1 Tax=Breoghania sp. TaxID=2065378 RepID=UPI0026134358|nr:hypothetical protein [Breoghania sp.]MDJ0933726.1 hypothetical protein [Breoghania sp.]
MGGDAGAGQPDHAGRAEGQGRADARLAAVLFGIEFGLVYSALGAAFVYAIAAAESPINAVGQIGGYVTTYLGFGASVLGVYVWQCSQEKRNGKA